MWQTWCVNEMKRMKIGWNEEDLQCIIKQNQQIFLMCLSRLFRNNMLRNKKLNDERYDDEWKRNERWMSMSMYQSEIEFHVISPENSAKCPKMLKKLFWSELFCSEFFLFAVKALVEFHNFFSWSFLWKCFFFGIHDKQMVSSVWISSIRWKCFTWMRAFSPKINLLNSNVPFSRTKT